MRMMAIVKQPRRRLTKRVRPDIAVGHSNGTGGTDECLVLSAFRKKLS
jgi:hypothetical protein